jgi:ATP-dependent RNA helicase DeaD
MPAAEELLDGAPGAPGAAPEGPQGPRPGFEDTVWFRMDIGRRHNADPRWLLPLLCRRGHITKNEIGAIRIAAGETLFEVPRAVAGKFAAALRRTEGGEGEGGVRIEAVQGKPRDEARQNRRAGPPPARHTARPAFRAKPNRPR